MSPEFRRAHGRRGRIPKTVTLAYEPKSEGLTPLSKSARSLYTGSTRTIYINPAEIEAQRLVDIEGLTQREAGEKMGISRGTVWRLLQAARKKTAQSLFEGRPLLIVREEDAHVEKEPRML